MPFLHDFTKVYEQVVWRVKLFTTTSRCANWPPPPPISGFHACRCGDLGGKGLQLKGLASGKRRDSGIGIRHSASGHWEAPGIAGGSAGQCLPALCHFERGLSPPPRRHFERGRLGGRVEKSRCGPFAPPGQPQTASRRDPSTSLGMTAKAKRKRPRVPPWHGRPGGPCLGNS